MKKSVLFFIFISIAMKIFSQTEYDCIGRDEFYILKVGSEGKGISNVEASELKSSKIAEQQFGTNFKTKNYIQEIDNKSYTSVIFDNGLELFMPDDQKGASTFRLTSNKYAMHLKNGTIIKIGMKADEFKTIFPKSYSKRKTITDIYGKIGKVSFPVFFSFTHDNKIYVEDALIIFTLSGERGLLEEIQSIKPD